MEQADKTVGSQRQQSPASGRLHAPEAPVALADHRPEALALIDLGQTLSHSPRVVAQRALAAGLNSGQSVAQSLQFKRLLGPPTHQTPVQLQASAAPSHTGLPGHLKSGIEALSGMSLDSVKVHYNSSRPAQLGALAYAQGTHIHVAPGQERHLPHEAWHVVQQAQGRVKPTRQFKEGIAGNDDQGLEHEADVMGAKAVRLGAQSSVAFDARDEEGAVAALGGSSGAAAPVAQRYMQIGIGTTPFQLADPTHVPAGSNVRGLLTAVQAAFSRRGFVLSAQGMLVLRLWCASGRLEPRVFQSPDDVAAALVELGYFYSKKRTGETTGPSTLGDRPGFTGDANRLAYGAQHGDTARRHVISSSTLGSAIEFSDGNLREINDFLIRHRGQPVEDKGQRIDVLTARRHVWQLVHNHVGNLWIGPSPINTAIGFIRSTINKALRAVAHSQDGAKVGSVIQMITPPQGPMDHAARTEWLKFALVLNARLAQLSDPAGTLNRAAASEFLLDASRNADLDVPHQDPGALYRARLRSIYAQILGTMITGNNLFQAGGTLDQFMALDAGTKVPSSPAPIVAVPDVGSSSHSTAQAMDIDSGDPATTATKQLLRLGEVPAQINGMHVRDVSGAGLNCLIRAILVAAGHDAYAYGDPHGTVAALRQSLVDQGFAEAGRMLDLAGGAGAMLISRLVHEGVLDAARGLVLYQQNVVTGEYEPLEIINGANPICLWLSNEHFRAVR